MRKRAILLVEDDETLLDTFQALLKQEGYPTGTAKSGDEALKKMEQGKFDLVMLDFVLRDVRGDEVALKIREVDSLTRIVFITGYPDLQKCIEALDLDVYEILLKPVSPLEIIRVAHEALSAKSETHPHRETRRIIKVTRLSKDGSVEHGSVPLMIPSIILGITSVRHLFIMR